MRGCCQMRWSRCPAYTRRRFGTGYSKDMVFPHAPAMPKRSGAYDGYYVTGAVGAGLDAKVRMGPGLCVILDTIF